MLEQIFGSNTRVLLLRLFLNNPERFYFVREITRDLGLHLNSVRRELDNLSHIGIVTSHNKADLQDESEKEIKDNKRYYKLNNNFVFIEELRALIIKANLILEESLPEAVDKLGDIKFCLLSGKFVGRDGSSVDLLLVGSKINQTKFLKLINMFESELRVIIDYTVLTVEDFLYRKSISDRFIYDLLDNKNLVVIDRLSASKS